MTKYFIQFAQSHEEFRLPELESLAQIENVKISYNKEEYKNNCPFLIIEIDNEEEATRLVKRAILIKNIYELWGVGKIYEDVHTQVKAKPERWPAYDYKSFKFIVSAFGSTCSSDYQIRIIDSFAYLGFKGDIDLKNPEVTFGVLEDYGLDSVPPLEPFMIYFGRLIASGNRDLIQTFNLKKRKYIGNTSMDAELSLIMANQALAVPGKLIYDPFVGTGSFLFTCAQFGSFTMGSDIDGRQIRGQTDRSVKSNVEQYHLQGKVLDTLVFDICHHPWRDNLWFDAIVTDPPYGVRAGAKTLGRKNPTKRPLTIDGTHEGKDYYPPTKPYEMSEVLSDLLEFAARFLVLGGRLVYWLPTLVDEYSSSDLPEHSSMRLVSNSEQNFGQWSRRLVTMEKFKDNIIGERTNIHNVRGVDNLSSVYKKNDVNSNEAETTNTKEKKKPGHYLFREKYFSSKSDKKQIWTRNKDQNRDDDTDNTT
ncbi:tRNA guanosine-2'-O-methyltransferase [Rhizophagus irregularis]|uniref:tRNA (guanine(10)-N(2))-methyltransferase n=2 Tax=Rhizophagus irregularis TaxID=588596 RepID=A0A2I1E8H0_9GLOM|nr:Trm11p [Rhizophagus irregularis DAOM 197198w]PKC11430.1 tRNA guanosine-2'-O-methyltransferase [Rhizophagus irregularis]GBC34877.1 tRNA guanosine-2'-O-methyltransferase [Rhizophagus irregularis DAOM 181602=DAOM 197198]PKC66993.1 tRNA guanosine-2'-O-methyltransferase [Rhizophagus irregularis]PKY18418.1 tRNA guanosine-2'-O-methyltransferase [Rhizophagus irregularis]